MTLYNASRPHCYKCTHTHAHTHAHTHTQCIHTHICIHTHMHTHMHMHRHTSCTHTQALTLDWATAIASSHLWSSLYREITLSTSPCKRWEERGKKGWGWCGHGQAPYPLQKDLLGLLKVFVEDGQLCFDGVVRASILSLTLWGRGRREEKKQHHAGMEEK